VAALQGRPDAAHAEYRQALALWEKLGNEEEAGKALQALAALPRSRNVSRKVATAE